MSNKIEVVLNVNAVDLAIALLGGITKAAEKMGVTVTTIQNWIADQQVNKRKAGLMADLLSDLLTENQLNEKAGDPEELRTMRVDFARDHIIKKDGSRYVLSFKLTENNITINQLLKKAVEEATEEN